MVTLPLRSFTMGSPAAEPRREAQESPQVQVKIAQPIAVGKYEVTFAEWDACVADGGCRGYRPRDDGWGRGNLPVINVDWADAQAYAAWLTSKTGKTYRLPSEAEWEYAARGGASTAYWWGAKASRAYANYGRDKCCGEEAVGADKWRNTSPVGSFPANAFGLHDMNGNVWEWVQDCWHDSHTGADTAGAARVSGECELRVQRGGAWSSMPERIRAAFRHAFPTHDRANFIGFRVARAP